MHMIMNLARDKREANWLQLFAQGKNFACRKTAKKKMLQFCPWFSFRFLVPTQQIWLDENEKEAVNGIRKQQNAHTSSLPN